MLRRAFLIAMHLVLAASVKGNFSQNGFCANCLGWPGRVEMQRRTIFFRRIFLRIFRACFPLSERQTLPKNSCQTFQHKRIQHRTRIQSRMQTRWSCKPNQFAYASSEKDLEERMFSSSRSSAPLVPPRHCPQGAHAKGA